MRQIFVVSLFSMMLFSTLGFASWNGKILNVQTRSEISMDELTLQLGAAKYVVLGEKHYTDAVQLAEGKIIDATVHRASLEGQFTTAWEFLNETTQATTADAFSRFQRGEITATDLLRELQGNNVSDGYSAMLEATKALRGSLIGVNLSRAEKAPVVKHGIEALDPKLLPPGFEMGGANYKERFEEAMGGGHSTPDQLANFYAAQCLTDDFMAYHLVNDTNSLIRFMIVGSFHTDYSDGFVARLKIRAAKAPVAVVKIIDASDYNAAELLEKLHDSKYGDIADFAYIVNEPTP